MPVSSTAAPAKLSADGTSRNFAKATPESLQHGQPSEAQSDRGEVPQKTSIAPAATQTSPRGHPKGVQTDRSVAAFAQGLAHEVAVEVGEFLGEKEADLGIAVDREASPSKPDKRFCTACGRRATIGVPKNTQTELSEDDPEDGVLWPKLSAYLYKGPTKHLAMNM
ncbi:hypothetical protein Pmar_PMAR000254 [Perkinsus marinus ATCC 50983]|uniref:Uncharacterized protein n=1 Tax=Perkinsus marinus (strain ATCC 50983 / TXsc) TaxID=423536 RepID=C5LNY2_PERM5|nr:hypothetical protein Pmar_PMAR000254 [Perkinsus marinus ATCC 50983]EER01564.1 hypothetical protein Pmar_PMAR000254 [Perkinsus marinus ATCC 50983]|eukprot:XP_002768846.1 hypothetical protein Pmar_PMAR000254 [Perkinsus marinus ATCC 50983]